MVDQAKPTGSIRFDGIEIDLDGHRLRVDGREVPLERKAFSVLVLLAGQPGRVFARDEILDAVWGHAHVTPGVLNRIVTLLRQALGERADTHRYLHTVHGVGYRFDRPLTGQPESDPARTLPESEVTASPMLPHAESEAAQAVPRGNARSPRAILRWRWTALAVVAVGLAAAFAWWRPATQGTDAHNLPSPTLIVMPLKPIAGAEADAAIAAGLSDELISALARIRGLRVIARESTGVAMAQSVDLAQLIARLGISHALEGSLRQSGDTLRIHLRLVDAANGRALWVRDYDRPVTDVFALEREIAGAVASALALELGLASAPAAKGGDAQFYRRYLDARAKLFTPGRIDVEVIERAELEFRALLEQRPDDARVHAGLALALDMRAYRRMSLAEGLRDEAAKEAERALQLDPGLPDPYRVQAAAACRAAEWERCLGLYRKTSALAPSETQPKSQYAMALAALGYLDQAETVMREGIARDPLNPGWRFSYGRILDTQGRHDEARAQFAQSAAFSQYGKWFNAVWRRDFDAARQVAASIGSAVDIDAIAYDRLLRDSYVLTTEALVDPTRWPEAEAAMRRTEQQTGLMNFLGVLQPGRDVRELIDGLDRVRQRSYSSWDLLLWTRDLAHLRRDPAFDDYLRRNGILDYWKQNGFPPQCRPVGDGAACD